MSALVHFQGKGWHKMSIFLKMLTIDTPYLAREGEIWGVCCEFKVWYMFYVITVCNIVIYGPCLKGIPGRPFSLNILTTHTP